MRALLVAINDYTLVDSTGSTNLKGCLNDSAAMQTMLRAQPFGFSDITTLHDRSATKAGLLAGLRDLCRDAKAGDVLGFYYSGHGSFVYDPIPDNRNRYAQGLYCADGQVLTDRELAAAVKSALADGVNLTIILDSCFSGGMGEVTNTPDIKPRGISGALPKGCWLVPFGVCATNSEQDLSTSNHEEMCTNRPNTIEVPYSPVILFSAVDYLELAGEVSNSGIYTSLFCNVISNLKGKVPTHQELQRLLHEGMEEKRAKKISKKWQHPLLRGQKLRMTDSFLQPFHSSKYGYGEYGYRYGGHGIAHSLLGDHPYGRYGAPEEGTEESAEEMAERLGPEVALTVRSLKEDCVSEADIVELLRLFQPAPSSTGQSYRQMARALEDERRVTIPGPNALKGYWVTLMLPTVIGTNPPIGALLSSCLVLATATGLCIGLGSAISGGALAGVGIGYGIVFGPRGTAALYGTLAQAFGVLGGASATLQVAIVKGPLSNFGGEFLAGTVSGGVGLGTGGVTVLFNTDHVFQGISVQAGIGVGLPISAYYEAQKTPMAY